MPVSNPLFTRISEHLWVIHGKDQARFPSGNAILIQTPEKLVIVDTNPGFERIQSAIQSISSKSCEKITDIVLSHTHLDHGRGIADIFESSQATIHAHPDTLKRCEKKALVGMYAGIPKDKIHYFEEFGQSLGFRDRTYPDQKKHSLFDGNNLKFGNVTVYAHETFGHCVHMLDYEFTDGDQRIILSCDYDFSPVPWYGIPGRGDSIDLFKADTIEIVKRNPNIIISSHRIEPIFNAKFNEELIKFIGILDARTNKAIAMCSEQDVALADLKSFMYPLEKMKGKYSDAYVHCAQWWDSWLLLTHLEKAWQLEKVECCNSGGDTFLERCIQHGKYMPRPLSEIQGLEWAQMILEENPPWKVPLQSRWRLKK